MVKFIKKAVDINKHIGRKLYEARRNAGFNLRTFAKQIDVSITQLAKYETGINQISIVRLLSIAETLSLDLDYFLRGIKPLEHNTESVDHQRKPLDIANDFIRIKDKACQEALGDLISLLSKKL